jgi:hypothetical protein
VPSPRDIHEVKEQIVNLLYGKFDVIWFKYYKELDAYQKAQQFFLNHRKRYDYLCIIPDDLILNYDSLSLLLNELENPSISLPEFGHKYPVLAGICNISYTNNEQMEKVAASQVVIQDERNKRFTVFWDHFLKFDELDRFQSDLIQVIFVGFSVEFIHRKVLEKIRFRHDNPERPSSGIDTFFSYDCRDLKIPIFIHRKASFVHLKGLSTIQQHHKIALLSTNPDVIYSGVYKQQVIFVDSDIVNK